MAFRAYLSGVKPVRTRGVYALTFEIDAAVINAVIDDLGGLPTDFGEDRHECVIQRVERDEVD